MKSKTSSLGRTSPLLAKSVAGVLLGTLAAGVSVQASTDYGPAIWRACGCTKWNTSGSGHRFYVIHDMEGYYAYNISASGGLRSCGVSVSVHYAINGKKDTTSDYAAGEITQMVRDAYYAWHARCWNGYSLGTEHEGFVSNPAWFTEAMYQASGTLVRSKCDKYGIAKDRNHVIGHNQKGVSGWVTWAQNAGYSYSWATCNTHSDPGPYWNWSHFMDIVKGTASTPSAPSSLTATVISTSQINLAWKDNSGIETGFKIERKTGSGGTYAQIATTGANGVSYANTGLASGTTYYYRVRAYNAAGNSGYSNEAGATTKDTIPAAPTSLAATAVSDTQINLTWAQAMANEDGFRIYRSADNVTFTLVATVGINAVSYSNTGLAGNTTYYYKVAAYNTAGNSAYSNTASDTTAPQTPSALAVATVAGTTNWNKLALTWTDNSSAEAGFKVERATASAGPFTQIGTTAAGVANYTDTGLAATTTYYYRVRSYNANGNSGYSNTASKATPNAPPVLTAIGDKTIASGTTLSFTATASDPNAPAPSTVVNFTWEGNADGTAEVVFRKPINSGSTTAFIDSVATNYTFVKTGAPAGVGGTKALKSGWTFKTGTANYWVRYTTASSPVIPNPTIALDQVVKFRLYATKALKVGLGVRETGTTAAYGADGGLTGAIEWVGVTNVISGNPIPNRLVGATNWTTLTYNIPFETQASFTGDGKVDQSGAKGVLEHIVLAGAGGTGAYVTWLDDLQNIVQNNLVYSLDAGAPAGATIGRRNGKFSWTPAAGTDGVYAVTVRVTDSLGGQDFETINVTVLGSGNAAPVLAAIGNKTVNELSALAFTATATDGNAGQTLTFSLDAGNPAGSSITTAGAFTWTPSETQGPGTYPITVRVTDNGSPSSNDFETITVTVNEANAAPAIGAIANQTISEGGTMSVTATATDSDVPANSVTFSIAGPPGITINSTTGAISWTAGEDDGGQTYQITVTGTDNGVPALRATRTFSVTVNEVNNAPALTVGTMNDLTTIAEFDELDDESTDGKNNATLFRVPYFSSSTTAFLDSTSYSYVTNSFPRSSVNSSYQALYVNMNFKTGTVNPWCRLTTHTSSAWTNLYAYPNPTINLSQHVRFKVWTDKSIKLAIGVRETGTLNPLGFDGGTSGTIEWVGATSSVGGQPQCTRTITASNWTQLDFNLPAEPKAGFSGNGVLDGAKGVLEELAIVPNAGSGFYNIYVDDFEALVSQNTSSITIAKGDTLSLTCTATDADLPAQDLAFSLGAGAPATAAMSDDGLFTWKPDATDAGSTFVIPLQVTDNGSPAMSDVKNITVTVNNINTPPRIAKIGDVLVENTGAVTFTASAQDDDVPAQTLTFSLISGPAGATINASTGDFTWAPPAGSSTNTATIRVTDNGSPALWDETTATIMVVPTNVPPVLNLGTARATESVVNYESFTNGTPNEQVMFKKPANSATTSAYIDTAATNYTSVTTSFPANASAGAKVMRAQWSFKTGVTGYWVRLNTLNTTFVPNPTINASARLKFDVYTTKSLKVGLGIRETGTTAENGANGGTTGNVEYVGVTSVSAGTPQPTRTVNANTWTTLEFDLQNEPKVGLTGDGILSPGQQVLEHLVLVGNGGTGAYTVYLDNFQVVTTTALPGTVTMKANSTLTFTASATDPDPGAGVGYGLDADFVEAHPSATLNGTTGAFSWTPSTAEVGTSSVTVTAEDSPTNGGVPKEDSKTFSIVVNADTLGAQSADGATFVAGGDTVTLSWEAAAGSSYVVQAKPSSGGDWTTVQTVAAGESSAVVTNSGNDSYYRVIAVSDSASE